MGCPILSAYDSVLENVIRIDNAVRGGRYKGCPGTNHQDCLLHPKFPARKRASFAHLPGEAYCPEGRGESSEHREAKLAWVAFIEDQLSGCIFCTTDGREAYPGHPCPATSLSGEVMPAIPSCHGILWFCESCNQPHLNKLLRDAHSVKPEWWTPSRTARVDIALLDRDGSPTTLIEIKRKNLSERPFEYAKENKIPLFVLDVSRGENVQTRLHNNGYQEKLIEMPDLKAFPPRCVDILRYSLQGTDLACRTDGEGRLKWLIYYSDPHLSNFCAPQPSIGLFILASESTVTCDEVNKELMSRTFFSGGELSEEAIDWRDW